MHNYFREKSEYFLVDKEGMLILIFFFLQFYPEGTILVAGFSKWAAIGGWRLGYAYIPPTLGSFYATTLQYASSSYSYASAPIQYAAAYVSSSCTGYWYLCMRLLGLRY